MCTLDTEKSGTYHPERVETSNSSHSPLSLRRLCPCHRHQPRGGALAAGASRAGPWARERLAALWEAIGSVLLKWDPFMEAVKTADAADDVGTQDVLERSR